MRRRDVITLLGGAAIVRPHAALAQAGTKQRQMGVLISSVAESDPEGQARVAALRQGLQERGWNEGDNIKIEYHWSAGNPDRVQTDVAQLVAHKPDVIFAAPTAGVKVLQQATRTIPIVFAQVEDPVGAGFVTSLNHPGGNMTGFADFEFLLGAKWLELLKQIAPSVDRVAIIYDPANPTSIKSVAVIAQAAKSVGVETQSHAIHSADEIERVISAFAVEPNSGLIPLPSPLIGIHRDLIIALATRYRLPNVYAFRYYPASGGLASYGVNNHDLYKRAAAYVDRILKGDKPGDLPVQEANKFELIINMKTAKILDLSVPQTLLATADEVIE